MSYRTDKLKMGWILTLKLNLTFKVKINHPPKTIGAVTKVFYTYGPNLVILAWTGDELSRGQAYNFISHFTGHVITYPSCDLIEWEFQHSIMSYWLVYGIDTNRSSPLVKTIQQIQG